MKNQILLFAIATSFCCSCKKNNSKDNPPASNLSVLENKILGKWQLVSSIDSSIDPARVTDVTKECEKDNIYAFNSDRTYTIDDAAYECIVPMVSGSWKVGADSLFKADIINCLCSSYPVLTYIDGTKMVLRNRNTSLSNYTVNTYRKL